MSSNSQSRQPVQTRQIAAYRALEPLEQAIVQILAIAYEPLSVQDLKQVMQYCGIGVDKKKKFDSLALRKALSKLQGNGLAAAKFGAPLKCDRLVVEVATRDTVREGRFEKLANAVEQVSSSEMPRYWTYFRSMDHGMRVLRLHVYRGQSDDVLSTLHRLREQFDRRECGGREPLSTICNSPFDGEWFSTLPFEIAELALITILSDSLFRLEPADDVFAFLEAAWTSIEDREYRETCRSMFVDQLVWRGRLADAEAVLRDVDSIETLGNRAWIALLRGNYEESLAGYEATLSALRQATGKRKPRLWNHHVLMHALALSHMGGVGDLTKSQAVLKQSARDSAFPYRLGANALLEWVENRLGLAGPNDARQTLFAPTGQDLTALDVLTITLVHHWMDRANMHYWIELLQKVEMGAERAGYAWLAAEASLLNARAAQDSSAKQKHHPPLHEQLGIRSLIDIVRKMEAWEQGLDALANIAAMERAADTSRESTTRIAWRLIPDSDGDDGVRLEAREVKRLSSGNWSKGKTISLKRLATDRASLPNPTARDLEVCSHIVSKIERPEYYGSPRVHYSVEPQAWLALAGHPMVFWEDGGAVELVKGDPELHVAHEGKSVRIQLLPRFDEEQSVCLLRETPTRIKVIECTPAHRRIAGIVRNGFRVPAAQKARVLDTLSRIASLITIHSDIGGGLENVPEVPGDPRLHIVMAPAGAGLRVQAMVKPLEHGSYYRPGAGGENVLAEIDGKRVQCRRALEEEQTRAEAAIAACPALALVDETNGEWLIDDPEVCLELIEQLHDLGDTVTVEWPQGETMRLACRASFSQLKVKVSGGGDWFEARGQLVCGDDRVFDMRQLLELLGQTPGRFIPLGEGEFLSLTKEFRKRLDEFRALTEQHGRGARFHPLAAPAVEGLFEGETGFSANKAWKEHLARFREAQAFEPEVPSTLRATLRDYQVEGFQWMARLARWGAGACLADDMGLGKTVQALALMVSHASEGPMLVVAPTSVCMNWLSETQRFAPTMNPILFGPGDRKAALDALGPFDVLVCSYGLLHQESEKLAEVRWRVAVLDEAQAIKNMTTRRSQAAMNLKADCRVITTGTPIENHLGELWNLFRFINPGLLRSIDQFNRRFAIPIEKHHDRDARARLKKTIQPFILRRVKEQVLEELPSRTEIVLHVEFSEDEAAFYEALRRKAVETLAGSEGTPGQKHMRILAEIMRLRRACCNAKLVAPDMDLPSAKLSVFLNLVDELLENRHKALVFSQFVDHLSILREALDAKKIDYQYLDGSTPQRERKKRVDAFQAGAGDLFLISLKAGGLGLNLTAADYVIHMDPWWNPAAEDQASDRAHRIGQQRPVTIYRLVTEGTIESKIVELHRRKRDLADSLLEGSEMSGKMSAEELLTLLQEGT